MIQPYFPESYADFSKPEQRETFQKALDKVKERRLGAHYPLIIGGRPVDTPEKITVTNPAKPDQVVGTAAKARREDADAAVAAAKEAYESWSRTTAEHRARILWKAAAILRERKHEFSALKVLEIGQAWGEADAQTAEAIDFLEYYGREAVRLSAPQPVTAFPGEENTLFYLPLGVGLVIPPWNFPGAIFIGTVAGPVAAGNTVIVKPASTTPLIGAFAMEIFEEAGMPPGVINFLPGPGAEVGEYLVEHPEISFINFTGSLEVGLRIHELAGKNRPEQIFLKRVAAELGGKNALIVDKDVNIDEAVAAAVTSAFGFQGQKCSAASRLIVLADIYDEFVEKLAAAARELTPGSPEDPDNFMGPVADINQFNKVLEYIGIGKGEGRLVCGGEAMDGAPENGYFIKPTVFADVHPDARIAQEEIFGPVVAVIKADDFDHALEIANGTTYALTGGVFSRNQANLEKARREFHVGNLYFNRKITGALVGVQPFGGMNLSGTNSKAGGPDYLKLFMVAKSVAEKL